ncbi:MAG: glycoside hydrolase family 73 protein [Clostridium sp.]
MKKQKKILTSLSKLKSNKTQTNKKGFLITGISILSLLFLISILTSNKGYISNEASEQQLEYKRQQEFISKLVPIAEANYNEFGVFPSVTIAQAIHESGWGESGLSVQANNLFGIKADTSWSGDILELPTQEYVNGEPVTTMAKWRSYDKFEDSVRDHGKFLRENQRYEDAGVFNAENYIEQVQAIKLAGYATDPEYANLICNTIEAYSLNLYDFNLVQGAKSIDK